jgi:hypothetical protein
MNILHYLIAVNVLALPLAIYVHARGECTLLTTTFGPGTQQFCQYISNPFMNYLYLNAFFLILGLLVYANSQVTPSASHSAPHKKPSSSHH